MSGMAALAAAAAATQKMSTTKTTAQASTPATTQQQTVRVVSPQVIQTSGQTIKLQTSVASPVTGQQQIRFVTPGQAATGQVAKQIIVQKSGVQIGQAGGTQLMTLVKTPQGLQLAPAGPGTKGIPQGQVVKLVATQAAGKAGGTPTLIQTGGGPQVIQLSASQAASLTAQGTTTSTGQKVITTVLKTIPSGVLTVSKGSETTGIFTLNFRINFRIRKSLVLLVLVFFYKLFTATFNSTFYNNFYFF